MRTVRAALFMAIIVLGLSACSSAIRSTSVPSTYTAPTIRTFPSARTGELIRCTFDGISAGVHVPPPGKAVGAVADGATSSVGLEVTRANDGSLVVSCHF